MKVSCAVIAYVYVLICVYPVSTFQLLGTNHHRHHHHHTTLQSPTTATAAAAAAAGNADYDDAAASKNKNMLATNKLKETLTHAIQEFRTLKDRDGNLSIDFGVKGGELNSTSRAPQKIDFYTISKDVGDKANEILTICEQLSNYTLIETPTEFLNDKENGHRAPLNGAWLSLFSTAADANFDTKNDKKKKNKKKNNNSTSKSSSKKSSSGGSGRGAAKVQNIVNATKGTITNVIEFLDKEDGTEPVLKQINVVIAATAVSKTRVALQFKYAKLLFTKFFFLKTRWSLYIPVPGPFITRCLVFVSRIIRFGRKKDSTKTVPKAYFDVMYLDQDLRIHKTGEDNVFVQGREQWSTSQSLVV